MLVRRIGGETIVNATYVIGQGLNLGDCSWSGHCLIGDGGWIWLLKEAQRVAATLGSEDNQFLLPLQ